MIRLLHSNPRAIIAMAYDLTVAALVWSFTFALRWNFELTHATTMILLQTLPAALAVQFGCFVYFGLYRGIWRYASTHDLKLIAWAVGTSALIIPIILLLWRNGLGVPRALYLLNPLLLILFMSSGRLLFRWYKENLHADDDVSAQPVLVLGAGNAALPLIDELKRSPSWYVVGLLDDNRNKLGRQIAGKRVLGTWDQLERIAHDSNCRNAILAVGRSDHALRQRAFEICERAHVNLLVIPDLHELMSGKVQVSQIRHVEVDDLLGRDPVQLDSSGLRQLLEARSVLVTGAGGSIGSELCRQIAQFKPRKLVLYELNEYALYLITESLRLEFPTIETVPIVGDVKDEQRLTEVFTRFRPHVVYHAAAYKHVPILEQDNAWQAVRNNAFGSYVLAKVASRFEVEKWIYVSTDKAVNPTSVMGASKRLAEMLLQFFYKLHDLPVVIVRFGNVLGSSGSVIPKFREQISRGGPVTVTHPEITRYFMSIAEATQLVLQAGLMGRGGEIFVLDMGEPIRIVDLARTMIRLSGFSDNEIAIEYSGLRPGEKLYEELLADNEKTLPTPHAKLRVARSVEPAGAAWEGRVRSWLEDTGWRGDDEVRDMLVESVPDYRPANITLPASAARTPSLPAPAGANPATSPAANPAPVPAITLAPLAVPSQPAGPTFAGINRAALPAFVAANGPAAKAAVIRGTSATPVNPVLPATRAPTLPSPKPR
jgi:FlaA1/EpsC-like NDP-sugar epimerase